MELGVVTPNTPMMDRPHLEVHTLRFGSPDWLAVCAPTVDGWCERHGYRLTVWGDEFPHYPTPKFGTLDMLKAFLDGPSSHMIFVDADILVHPDAPALQVLSSGFHAATDAEHDGWTKAWRQWCKDQYKRLPNGHHAYRNSGVWACDRDAAAAFLKVAQPPFLVEVLEQHQWNWWWSRATDAGMPMKTLPSEWNSWAKKLRPAWFYHVWGANKMQKIQRLRDAGLIP